MATPPSKNRLGKTGPDPKSERRKKPVGIAAGPVFVDESGRRARWVVVLGRVVGVVCVAYVGLAIASLLGAPWVPQEVLPSVGPSPKTAAPAVTLPPTARRQPAPVLSQPVTTIIHRTKTTRRTPAKKTEPQTTATTTNGLSSTTTGQSSSTTTSSPGRSGTAPGQSSSTTSTTAPGQSGTAPGQSSSTTTTAAHVPSTTGASQARHG